MCDFDGSRGRKERRARQKYEQDIQRAEKQAVEMAERQTKMLIDSQKASSKRMETLASSLKPEDPTKYIPKQVRSSYDDSNMGVGRPKAKRKKANLNRFRIKLNPSLNIASEERSTTNLG